MSTDGFGSWCTAKARIAPTAIRIRLTGRPTPVLYPLGVEQERSRHARVVTPPAVAGRRVLLEGTKREVGTRDCRRDLAEAARACGEVALTPVHQPVDAE